MEIIDYDKKYDEQIKDLIVELQNYLIDIDDWNTQVLLPNYREDMFKLDMDEVKDQNGKVLLASQDGEIVGLIIGVVEVKDEIDKLTNDCAKTGKVSELIVKNNIRGNGVGKALLDKIEDYFRSIDCKRINIEVFGPNSKGLNFYEKNNYIVRDMIVSKRIQVIIMIKYINKTPLPSEFNFLTEAVGWGVRNENIVKEALENTLYSLCVYDDDQIVKVHKKRLADCSKTNRFVGDRNRFGCRRYIACHRPDTVHRLNHDVCFLVDCLEEIEIGSVKHRD